MTYMLLFALHRGGHKITVQRRYNVHSNGSLRPLTPNIDTATWAFLGLSDMGHGL